MLTNLQIKDAPTGSDTFLGRLLRGDRSAFLLGGQPPEQAPPATGEDTALVGTRDLRVSFTAAFGRALAECQRAVVGQLDDLFERLPDINAVTAYAQDEAVVRRIQQLIAAQQEALAQMTATFRGRMADTESPAERLRRVSGLDSARLAAIFGVTRAAYQNWIAGATPRGSRREDLLQILSLVQEAAERIGYADALSTWLLTPVGPGGSTPLDFLAGRDYAAFRGFQLRTPIERRLLRSPRISPRPGGEVELKEAKDRFTRRLWDEEESES